MYGSHLGPISMEERGTEKHEAMSGHLGIFLTDVSFIGGFSALGALSLEVVSSSLDDQSSVEVLLLLFLETSSPENIPITL